MDMSDAISVVTRRGPAVAWLVSAALGMLLPACGPIEPGHISPLSGTWKGLNSPGGGYFGTVLFDDAGHLDNLGITTLNGNQLYFMFDGRPHLDPDGNQYVATADTTLTDGQFQVEARVEYSSGKYKGITRIAVAGVVDLGSMTGTIRIAFPGSDPFVQDFKAAKT